MIKIVQKAAATDIRANIKDNTSGDITGNLLQEKMLLLNRGAFGGEIEYYEDGELVKLKIHELLDCMESNYVSEDTQWGRFLREFDSIPNLMDFHYVALWNHLGGMPRIEAYMVLYKNYRMTDGFSGPAIEMKLIANASWSFGTLSSIALAIVDNWDDNFFIGATYTNQPRILEMDLNGSVSFSDRGQLLQSLKITSKQWGELAAGQYTFVRRKSSGEILPIMNAEKTEAGCNVVVGYRLWDSAHYWVIIDDSITNTYSITLTDV